MPPGRHSAVYLDNGRLVIRLRSRKNRPEGSLLVRDCVCNEDSDPRLCPVHCFDWTGRTSNHAPGEKIFTSLTPSSSTHKLRRYATLVGIGAARQLGLKTFRASRATCLALQGKLVHHILAAGEWRSAAFLRYCSEDSLDAGAVLKASILEDADSADEDESAA